MKNFQRYVISRRITALSLIGMLIFQQSSLSSFFAGQIIDDPASEVSTEQNIPEETASEEILETTEEVPEQAEEADRESTNDNEEVEIQEEEGLEAKETDKDEASLQSDSEPEEQVTQEDMEEETPDTSNETTEEETDSEIPDTSSQTIEQETDSETSDTSSENAEEETELTTTEAETPDLDEKESPADEALPEQTDEEVAPVQGEQQQASAEPESVNEQSNQKSALLSEQDTQADESEEVVWLGHPGFKDIKRELIEKKPQEKVQTVISPENFIQADQLKEEESVKKSTSASLQKEVPLAEVEEQNALESVFFSPEITVPKGQEKVYEELDQAEVETLNTVRSAPVIEISDEDALEKSSAIVKLDKELDSISYQSGKQELVLQPQKKSTYLSSFIDGMLSYESDEEIIYYYFNEEKREHKEIIGLPKAPATPYQYDWALENAENFTVRQELDGAFLIIPSGKTEEAAFKIPPSFLIDAQGQKIYDQVVLDYENGTFSLRLIDQENLQYPIAIDPTIIFPPVEEESTPMEALPMALVSGFQKNKGQHPEEVSYSATSQGYKVFVTKDEMVYVLNRTEPLPEELNDPVPTVTGQYVFRQQFLNTSPASAVQAENKLSGKINYLKGNDPNQWSKNIPVYNTLRFAQIYSGIDLIYDYRDGEMKYEYEVSPGVSPYLIENEYASQLRTTDGDQEIPVVLSLDEEGNLIIQANEVSLMEEKPYIYQVINDKEKQIEGRFRLLGDNRYGFEIGEYDHSLPLFIDPVITASTFIAGTIGPSILEGVKAIARDSSGNIYISGITSSSNFPVLNPFQTDQGDIDVFVSKFNPDLSTLIYSTYVGGEDTELGSTRIEVNAAGELVFATRTTSTAYPTTAGSHTPADPGGGIDSALTILNADGDGLVYSTYVDEAGGTGAPFALFDSSGNAYIGGQASAGFTTTAGVIDPTGPGSTSAFLSKYDPTQSGAASLLFATFIPMLAIDSNLFDVDFNSTGDIILAGIGNLDPTGATNTYVNGAGTSGYVMQMNSTATAIQYTAKFSSGFNVASFNSIAIDSSDNILIGGTTSDATFPTTAGVIDQTHNGGRDYIIFKLDPTVSGAGSLLFSTFYGGTGSEYNFSTIALDNNDTIYFAAKTLSLDIPEFRPLKRNIGVENDTGFIGRMNSDATTLLNASYIGTTSTVELNSMVLDPTTGTMYLGGEADSSGYFPSTAGSYDPTFNGFQDNPFITIVSLRFAVSDLRGIARNGEVSLLWTPLDGTNIADGGQLPTGYEVESRPAGGTFSLATSPAGNSSTITGLTNGTTYEFRVRGINGFGPSAYSNIVSLTPTDTCDTGIVPSGADFIVTEGFCNTANRDGATTASWSSFGELHFPVTTGTISTTPYSTPAAGNSVDVQVADFNQDGFLDIVAPSNQDSSIRIFYNDGDGTFDNTSVDITVQNGPRELKVGFLNSDNWPDIVVVNTFESSFSVLINDQTGAFPTRQDLSAGSQDFHSVDIADFNNDGFQDLVLTERFDNYIRVYPGDGTGNYSIFNRRGIYTDGFLNEPQSVETADYNRDGFADIAFLHNASAGFLAAPIMSIMYGDQNTLETSNNAGLQDRVDLVLPQSEPYDIESPDLNGDGFPDLAVITWDGGGGTLSVFLNNGDKSFAPRVDYATDEALALTPADINQDGFMDIVVGNTFAGTSTIATYLGDGTGLLAAPTIFNLPGNNRPRNLRIADTDNDGELEVIIAIQNQKRVLVGEFLDFVPASNIAQSSDIAGGNTYGSLLVNTTTQFNSSFDLQLSNDGVGWITVGTNIGADLMNEPVELTGDELYFRITLNGAVDDSIFMDQIQFTLQPPAASGSLEIRRRNPLRTDGDENTEGDGGQESNAAETTDTQAPEDNSSAPASSTGTSTDTSADTGSSSGGGGSTVPGDSHSTASDNTGRDLSSVGDGSEQGVPVEPTPEEQRESCLNTFKKNSEDLIVKLNQVALKEAPESILPPAVRIYLRDAKRRKLYKSTLIEVFSLLAPQEIQPTFRQIVGELRYAKQPFYNLAELSKVIVLSANTCDQVGTQTSQVKRAREIDIVGNDATWFIRYMSLVESALVKVFGKTFVAWEPIYEFELEDILQIYVNYLSESISHF